MLPEIIGDFHRQVPITATNHFSNLFSDVEPTHCSVANRHDAEKKKYFGRTKHERMDLPALDCEVSARSESIGLEIIYLSVR